MFFVSNRLPSSQARCRRFDPGLPLEFLPPIHYADSWTFTTK
jgi:hypothetical protein